MKRGDKPPVDPRLPHGARPPRLIVCERHGLWAVALRRELPAPGPRLLETRSLEACWQRLAQCPSSFVVAELEARRVDALLERLSHGRRLFPLARVAVVAERSLAGYGPLVREAGAVHFTTSPRAMRPLARLACRHLAQAAHPKRTFTETIWDGLPWAPGAADD
jgi:hypothetical protein